MNPSTHNDPSRAGRIVVGVAAAFLLLTPGAALAADLEAELKTAREALTAGDTKAALEALERAEDAAGTLSSVAPTRSLASIWYYRGIARHQMGDKKGLDMEAWRNALAIDNELPWSEELYGDGTAWNLFEALRTEVRDRPQVDPGVPEKTGAAKIFVDGNRVRHGETVLQGIHLGQIECPDGAVYGTWSEFDKQVKWFKMCPGGVDTSVIIADEEASDDEWGGIGPAFGEPASTDVAADASTTDGSQVVAEFNPGPPAEVVRKKVLWPAFAGGVAFAAGAGALQYVALRKNAAYNDLENPDYQTPAELEDLRKSTNRTQTLVYPLLAVSGGLFFAATYQW